MSKLKKLIKISKSQVTIFKITNRKGYAAICKNNLTEGRTTAQAMDRMTKALKRMGYEI
ncbi:MAG: hypothetical protein ABIH85_03895 [Candidatus Omnitrophota bacterium]|nr:hypothetical protein [Candidatus Omnitrophota bacterium]MBU1894536.1 hypothetical protein [Candidatus Omnitrophota bacterium]